LHHHLPPGQRGLSEYVSHSSSGGSRLPINAAVLDAMHQIPRTLHQWANVCRHMKGYCLLEMEGKRWAYLLSDAVIDLESFDEELHYSEYGVDYLTSVFEAHSRMFSLAGLAHLVHRLNAACPACGRRELVRHNGQEVVRCTRCGEKWSEPEYRRLTIVQARAHNA
jgi:ribosomal protein L37AE/L43A